MNREKEAQRNNVCVCKGRGDIQIDCSGSRLIIIRLT